MKRFFAITLVLMIILMSLGCAATVPDTTTNPAAGKEGLVSTVGNRPFVGEYSKGTLDGSVWNPRGGR